MNETCPFSNFYLHIAFPSALASEGPANTDDPVWVVLYAAPLSPFRGGGPHAITTALHLPNQSVC